MTMKRRHQFGTPLLEEAPARVSMFLKCGKSNLSNDETENGNGVQAPGLLVKSTKSKTLTMLMW